MSNPRFEIAYSDNLTPLMDQISTFLLDNSHPAREIILKHFDLLDGDLYIEVREDDLPPIFVILNKDGLYHYMERKRD